MYAVFSGLTLKGLFKWHAHAADYADKCGIKQFRIVDLEDWQTDEADFHLARLMAFEVERIAAQRYQKPTVS